MSRIEAPDLIGQTLGSFKVTGKLGAGGMGTVYEAIQLGMDRPVALKVLPPKLAENQTLLQRFYLEARAAAKINHPNIVQAILVGEANGLHYFAMEFVAGYTLAQTVRRKGRLSIEDTLKVASDIGEALQAAHHAGLVHRDVKPENILMSTNGRSKLADLGLVKQLGEDLGLTQVGKGLGTVNYMAPEQFRHAKDVDPRSDIYALALTLFTAITGTIPFLGLGMKEIFAKKTKGEFPQVPDGMTLPDNFQFALHRATHPNPDRRPAKIQQFLEELGVESRMTYSAPQIEIETQESIDIDGDAPGEPGSDKWFVEYCQDGRTLKLSLTTEEVRHGIRSGRLSNSMRISRSPDGPWQPPGAHSDFVDLTAQINRAARPGSMLQEELEQTVSALHAPQRRSNIPWIWIAAASLLSVAVGVGYLLMR